jgi:hypothetical protein
VTDDYLLELLTLTRTVGNDLVTRWRNSSGQLHRVGGPAVEYSDGSAAWFQNDKLHRIGGPAIERATGTLEWFQNGKRHRIDGPAISYSNGVQEWWENGTRIK